MELAPTTSANKMRDARVESRAEAQATPDKAGACLDFLPKSMMTAVEEIRPDKRLAMGKPH